MQLFLLYTAGALLVGSINADTFSETKHIPNDFERQIAENYSDRDDVDGMNAEYFKALQASKLKIKAGAKERLASAAEYFKAPDASELRSNALILAQERLADAAEYLKAQESTKRVSRTKVGNALAATAEYLTAPEFPRHNHRIDRIAESLAATAVYLKATESPKRLSRTKVAHALAVAAEYFKAPESPRHESPRHNNRITRTAESLTAAAEYFKTPELQRHNTKIGRTIEGKAAAAKHFRITDYYSKRRKYLATHGRPMFRPTKKANRRRFIVFQ